MSNIAIKYVEELRGKSFEIPVYQRGYRWTEQNVKDLLNDIKDHFDSKDEFPYCVQPLVVKDAYDKTDSDKLKIIKRCESIEEIKKILNDQKFRVIDGQQRLTTIYIILKYLSAEKDSYSISYSSRDGSEGFLKRLGREKNEENIDYYYMCKAWEAIDGWFFQNIKREDKENFKNHILKNVCFIWYEASATDKEEDIFTRLNKNKIPLTNSELIKALILNEANFKNKKEDLYREQIEIASEWDKIENALQENDFWYFLHKETYNNPTRIDFIFEILKTCNAFKIRGGFGDDKYQTFRYFYACLKNNIGYKDIWNKVKDIFNIFNEWFNSLELYHYVGFLVHSNYSSAGELLEKWLKLGSKNEFNKRVKKLIKEKIDKIKDLSYQYDESRPKSECKPILLLFNLQTIIKQNLKLKKQEKYQQGVFFKFPFGLYQKEKWDIEHIASNTDNPLDSNKDIRLFLNDLFIGGKIEENKYNEFIENLNKNTNIKEIRNKLDEIRTKINPLDQNLKNQICNYALLDSSTNRGYGNSLFSVKRRHIICKDQGVPLFPNESNTSNSKSEVIAFVPPCTKNVFLKYYTKETNDLSEWNKVDAENYRKEIEETLKEFLVETEAK